MEGSLNLNDINIKRELKIVFMGTPDFAVPILEGLLENYKIRAVITQPDKMVGRDQRISFSPVKKCALEHTLLVLQPENLKEHMEEIINLEADLIITCAYGKILPLELLKSAKIASINVHASLLPKLRGGAPIHRAIMAGSKKSGITIMYMDKDMDAGDIISQREVEITDDDTAETLHDKLKIVGKDLLLETLPSIINRTNDRIKQDSSQVTYGFVIKREDERIDFSKTKREIYNHVRGLNSWPGAYCYYLGKILKIWACYQTTDFFPDAFDGQITKIYSDGFGVKVSNGEIVVTELQVEGKRKMKAVEFLNGIKKEELIGKVLD